MVLNATQLVNNFNIAYSNSAGAFMKMGALRAEQGEYIIASLNDTIGTYNVHQCVVIYIRGSSKHGLAHIDGHVEIGSVDQFLNIFFLDARQQCGIDWQAPCETYMLPEVKVIGALGTETKTGLNDAELNLEKTLWLLNNKKIQYIRVEDKHNDFIFNSTGHIIDEFPTGIYDECSALHGLQQLKRKDDYMGTYPIIRGCDGLNFSIYLDDRAIFQLNKYDNHTQVNKNNPSIMRLGIDLETSFYPIMEYISFQRNASLTNLMLCANASIRDLRDFPLIIPESSVCTANQYLLSKVVSGQRWQVDPAIVNIDGSKGTVTQALEIVTKYDHKFNKLCLLGKIEEKYNCSYGQLQYMRYDARISVTDFITILGECKSTLYPLILLTSVEEVSFKTYEFNNHKALSVSSSIGSDAPILLHCIMYQHNLYIQERITKLTPKDYYAKLNKVITNTFSGQLIQTLSKKAYKSISSTSYQCDDEDCKEKIRITIEQDCIKKSCDGEALFGEILYKAKELEVLDLGYKITLESQFNKIRAPYLKALAKIFHKNLLQFDEYTISKILSYPNYSVPLINEDCSDIKCYNKYAKKECEVICALCELEADALNSNADFIGRDVTKEDQF